jgi:hypothetical protein
VEGKFVLESCFQKEMYLQIPSLITSKEVHMTARSSKSIKIGTKLDGFDRLCPQITSLAEIFCVDHPEIMGQPGIFVPDHFGNMNFILQTYSDVDLNITRGTLVRNIENSSQN